jgi:Domain of unknown function (DUF4251)
MKSRLLLLSLLTIGMVVSYTETNAQNSKKERKAAEEALVKKSVEEKQYVFTARSANPTGGRSINLTSTYELKVYGDTVICDLPYFGRAFTATSATGGGINFTSTNVEYISTDAKKGGWDIKIKPKDAADIREVNLFISPSGYTSVTVTSNSRQSISYYGTVSERKYKKKK